jgi:hypothetical protein
MQRRVLLASLVAAAAARAAEPVDLALALVSDVSRSIDDGEYKLEKDGYVTALTDPQVLAAIAEGEHHAIAIAYAEFAGAGEMRSVLDWTVLRDAASAGEFARKLAAAPRSFFGRTAIGDAIAFGQKLHAATSFGDVRQVIDICGDGINNSGQTITEARDAAVAAGMTVNGLTIINEHAPPYLWAHTHPPGGLTKYYRDNVIGGPGAFVVEVHDFAAFGKALTRKLLQEIAWRGPASLLVRA